MRKIELYESFRNNFSVCCTDPLDWTLTLRSLQEAKKRKDIAILRVILRLDNDCDWYIKVIQQERAGIKAIPDYLWDAMADKLDSWADQLCQMPQCIPFDARIEDEKKRIDQEIASIEKKLDDLQKGTLLWRITQRKIGPLIRKKMTLPKPLDQLHEKYHYIDHEILKRDYLNGEKPESLEQLHAAHCKVANEIRNYAKMLREAEA